MSYNTCSKPKDFILWGLVAQGSLMTIRNETERFSVKISHGK